MPKPGADKTEKATPLKLRKARKEGQIAHSPELASWLTILAASFIIPQVAQSLMQRSETTMIQIGGLIQDPDTGTAMVLTRKAILGGASTVAPLLFLILLTSVLSSAGQSGGVHFAPKVLKPKMSRLNPLQGLKRMFGTHGLWQLAKSLAKMLVLSLVTYLSIRNLIPTLVRSGTLPVQAILDSTASAAMKLIRYGSAAGLVMAMADVVVVHRRNAKQLRMSKQEVKDEYKNSEGDPRLKSARRSRALSMSRNRMMADVANADVLVVNPTHFSVALKYDPARGAPRVVAKGGDYIALQIRRIAEENRVPIVQDIPLARTLYATCKLGHEIPPELYHGVAAVLAFVMRLKRRGAIVGEQRMAHH
jgi:flagellar biosynthetic protein FlhB